MKTRAWISAVAAGLGVWMAVVPGQAATVGGEMLLRVVDERGCSRTIEIRPDSTFSSSELAPGRYTLWWGTTPASGRRATERKIAAITVWHRARMSPQDGGVTAVAVTSETKAEGASMVRLTKDLDLKSPMLSTKLGTVAIPAGGDGLTGRIEFTTSEGRRVALEDWVAPRTASVAR